MRLGDIYKSKTSNSFICIDSFITRIGQDYNEETNPLYIVVNILQIIDNEVAHCPSDNKYGTQEEIEEHYELYLSSDKLTRENYYEEMDKIKELIEQDYVDLEAMLDEAFENNKDLANDIKQMFEDN